MSNPVTDLKRELLAAAERQHQPAAAPVKERRFRGSARVPRLLPIAAAVAIAASAVLFFTAPWSSSPKNHPRVAPPQLVSFLVKTKAALTPPKDKILHAELESTGCSGKVRWTAQFWSDEHTGAYRGLFHDPVLPYPFRYFSLWELQHLACMRPHTYEAGAVLGPRNLLVWSDQQKKFIRTTRLLRFVPPNTLYRYPFDVGLDTFGRVPALDPVKAVRNAIHAGRAHDQGRTTLHGRTVERIRVNPCPPNKPSLCTGGLIADGGYAYVDPKTHYPVEIRADGGITRFSTYEYLPRTAANLALTNIRAQHPHARLSG